jgi:peptidoglycan/xylan/chitin deacetylase (PgdA/CDA1 family)
MLPDNRMLDVLSGLTGWALRFVRPKPLFVLIYHHVLAQPDPLREQEIDAETFDWQMALLARYFNVLPMQEGIRRLNDGSLPPKAVCITFDDGYADNYLQALPILQRYGLSACFFVSSGYLNGGRMWNDTVIEALRLLPEAQLDLNEFGLGYYPLTNPHQRSVAANAAINAIKHLAPEARREYVERLAARCDRLPDDLMMTDRQVLALRDAGMTIGGHTISHPILANLSLTDVDKEIRDNKAYLEALLGERLNYFAYPNGKPGSDYLPEHFECVRNAGYETAFSTRWGVAGAQSDRWQLPRFTPWDKQPAAFMVRMARYYLAHRL